MRAASSWFLEEVRMKDTGEIRFQEGVTQYLSRHRSILDVQSKLTEAAARVNRAIAKSVTTCGCITVNAGKQTFPKDAGFRELGQFMSTHLSGEMCARCREVVETELGMTLFYLAALCSLLGLSLRDVLAKEYERVNALGVFNLT
jgi:hypothetical protein